MDKNMFIKKISERMKMARQINKRRITIQSDGNSVVIKDGDITSVYPKNELSIHTEEGKTDSIELRMKASRKNIMSFRLEELASPKATDISDAETKIAQIINQ